MRRASVFVLLGLGVLLLVGLLVKRGAFEPSASQPGTSSPRLNEKTMPTGNAPKPADNIDDKTEVEGDRPPMPGDPKAVRAWVAQRVKKIIVEQLVIETVTEESQYSDLGVDELDCAELMDEFETEFKMRTSERDQKNLCASTVGATILYISGRLRLQYKVSSPRKCILVI